MNHGYYVYYNLIVLVTLYRLHFPCYTHNDSTPRYAPQTLSIVVFVAPCFRFYLAGLWCFNPL